MTHIPEMLNLKGDKALIERCYSAIFMSSLRYTKAGRAIIWISLLNPIGADIWALLSQCETFQGAIEKVSETHEGKTYTDCQFYLTENEEMEENV